MTSPSDRAAAAFFDVDGTLCDTTIAHYFRFFMFRRLSPTRRRLWYAVFLAKCGYYLLLDRVDRQRLNVVFYRNYAGLNVAQIKAQAEECYTNVIAPRMFEPAAACVEEQRGAGRRVVLVTGSLDFVIEPLARRIGAADVIASRLIESDGRFTGVLDGAPIGGVEKARLMRAYAQSHGVDLRRSHAFGDSVADLPMLESVGYPHAVNPHRGFLAKAVASGWATHHWKVVRS